MKTLLGLLLLAGAGVAALAAYKTLTPPSDLYLRSGTFAGCPARPDCVSSVAGDDQHRVAALGYTGDTLTAQTMLREVIERMGGKIVHERPGYLHAVFVSPTLQFRDDLEALLQDDGRIDVRSNARFGLRLRDAGTHRQRVEELRRAFEATP